jgi:hypothetical protein
MSNSHGTRCPPGPSVRCTPTSSSSGNQRETVKSCWKGTRPTFQDDPFNSACVVERTLKNGILLRLKLEPLPGERVRVLEYHRKASGERRQRLREEESRTLHYDQLKLRHPFAEVFNV